MLLGFGKYRCQLLTLAGWKRIQEKMTVKGGRLRTTQSKFPFLEFSRDQYHCHRLMGAPHPAFPLHLCLPSLHIFPSQILPFFLLQAQASLGFLASAFHLLFCFSLSAFHLTCYPPLSQLTSVFVKGSFWVNIFSCLFSSYYCLLKRPQHGLKHLLP